MKEKKRKEKIELILLSLILFLGAFLRFIYIGKQSLWIDETGTYELMIGSISSIIKKLTIEFAPPFYYIFPKISLYVFGKNEFAMRLPSVIFGILSIFMIYKLGKYLFNNKAGLISALILATNPLNIATSQNARPYSLSILLTLISIFYFFKILKEGKIKNWIFYIISSALLIYTHPFNLFIILIQNVYMLIIYRKNFIMLRNWFLSQLILFILYLPWLSVTISAIFNAAEIYYYGISPSLFKLLRVFPRFSGYAPNEVNKYLQVFNLELNFTDWLWIFCLLLICFVFFISFVKAVINIKKNKNSIFFLLLFLILPVLIIFLISKIYTPLFEDKYFLTSSIALYLIVGYGISMIRGGKKKILFISLILLVIFLQLMLNVFGFHDIYFNNYVNDFRTPISYIEQNSKQNDLVLYQRADNPIHRNFGLVERPPLLFYYNGNLDTDTLYTDLNGRYLSKSFSYFD